MRMIDEDEVGLKENLEHARYIKKDPKHRECGQRTRFPTLPLLGTADSEMGNYVSELRQICTKLGHFLVAIGLKTGLTL